MRFTRLALVAVAAVVLALPAAVSAHPSVYTGEATIVESSGPPPVFDSQERHMVTNHGYTTVLRETNNVGAPGGVVSYALLPSALRGTLSGEAEWLTEGGTGAQAHATCSGVTALSNPDNILAWQAPDDPFYNYVPFQKASAGLDDNPADWIDDVQALTDVDLSTVSDDPAQAEADLTAACMGIGGTFVPADETQNTIAALASGTVEHETAPLIAEIDELTTFTEQLEAQKAAAEKAAADARAAMAAGQVATTGAQAAAAAQAEVARLSTRLRLKPVGAESVEVTGPAGKRVIVRMRLTTAAAKAARWESLVLAKETVTLGQDGTALVGFALGRQADAALRKADADGVYFAARSGDRWTSTRER
jgi:hypothetical protein